MVKNVEILSVFEEDRRVSMELYAQRLKKSIETLPQYEASIYQPKLGNITQRLPLNDLNKMRIARYIDYPQQAKRLRKKAELFHIADHGYAHLIDALPKEKTIVTVHDIIPIVAYYGGIPGMTTSRKPRLAIKSASNLKKFPYLITVSENSKRDIMEYCDVEEERISVLYYGIDGVFSPNSEDDEEKLAHLNLPNKPILLSIGSQIYKNTERIFKVFQILKEKHDIQLCHVGPRFEKHKDYAESIGLADSIRFLGRTTPTTLAALYRKANQLLFPSLYEGFGWPPLEAMACGCPAIISNRASLPEIGGDAAIICDAFDVDEMSQQSERLLTDGDYHDTIRSRSLKHAKTFSWQRYSDQLAQIYAKLL